MRRALLILIVLLSVPFFPTRTARFTPFVVEAVPVYTNIRLAKGTLNTTLSTVLYTVPASTTVIVMSLSVASTATGTTVRKVTISLAGVVFLPAFGVSANTAVSMQLNQVLLTTETITGGQDVGTDVTYYISGVAIT